MHDSGLSPPHPAAGTGGGDALNDAIILCGDAEEAERLALRDFAAICPPANAATSTLAEYRGSLVVVTPNGRRERAGVCHVLRALGCDVRTLTAGFAVDTDDPLTNPTEHLFARGNGGDVDDRNSLCPLTVAEVITQPLPRWLVRGVLAERSLAVIFGAPGSGKTFMALDMAASIARGVPWQGRRVQHTGVVYVAAEGHLRVRLMAYLEHHQLPAADLSRLRVVASGVNLLASESGDVDTLVVEIKKAAADMGGVALLVLDTLNSMMPGGNENASEDMGAMIASARRIMEAINCAVAYVHHSGKDESKGSRGHSSLKAAVDVEIQITGDGDRVAELVKVRDGEQGQRFPFRLQAVDLGPDLDPDAEPGERQSSCVVVPLDHLPVRAKPKIRRDVALEALREALSEFGEVLPQTTSIPPRTKAVTLDQWRTRWSLRTGYEGSPGHSIAVNFHKDKDALLRADAIRISKPYVWIN